MASTTGQFPQTPVGVSPGDQTQQFQLHGQFPMTGQGFTPGAPSPMMTLGSAAPPAAAADDLITALQKQGSSAEIERMLTELKLQHGIHVLATEKEKTKAADVISANMMVTSQLMVAVGVVDGYVKLFHSFGKFVKDMFSNDEKLIGFVGDRKDGLSPTAVELTPAQLGWGTIKNVVTSERELATFYAKADNKQKLFKGGAASSKQAVFVPVLLLVPSGVVAWLLADARTPMEYHDKLIELLGGEDPDKRPKELDLSLLWCRVAAHSSAGNKSVLDLPLRAILNDSPVMSKFITDRLATTMGPVPVAQPQVVFHPNWGIPPSGYPPQGWGPAGLGQSEGQLDNRGAVSTIKEKNRLSDIQRACLKGYAHVLSDSELEEVWFQMQSYTELSEIGDLIKDAMEEVRKDMNIDLGEMINVTFSDELLKDIRKVNMAPNGARAFWDWLMRGPCILHFMGSSSEAVHNADMARRVWDMTENTRTEEQAYKRLKTDPKTPPGNWSKLKYVITTYCIYLRAMHGKCCPLYKSTWAVREVIVAMKDDEKYFDRFICRRLVWRIIKDGRNFFSKKLMPADFKGNPTEEDIDDWPSSRLTGVTEGLLNQEHAFLDTRDFPWQWAEGQARQQPGGNDNNANRRQRGQQGFGGGFVGQEPGNGDYTHHRRHNHDGRCQEGGVPGQYGPAGHGPASARIQARLGGILEEVRRAHAAFGSILMAGGIRITDLPTLPAYQGPRGRSSMCYSQLLGLCLLDASECSFQSVRDDELTDDFVNRFVQVMRPALEAFLEQGARNQRSRGGRQRGGRPGQH